MKFVRKVWDAKGLMWGSKHCRLLSRAHSNYLAQINIRMNERQEQTADVLGRLTVLGTIVLPMNIITGMWGMNVLVPGQETENLWWFWSSEFPRISLPLPLRSARTCAVLPRAVLASLCLC